MQVLGTGPSNAKIAIVGEAPGATENRTGTPFVGKAGRELNKLLKQAGIDRDACYLTNVVKVQPLKNNFGVYYQDKERSDPTPELLQAHDQLLDELQLVHPNIIIALGNEALSALTGMRDITKRRGSIYESDVGKVLATIHPSMLLRTQWSGYKPGTGYKEEKRSALPVWAPLVVADLKKARLESEFPEIRRPKRDIYVCRTLQEVQARLMSLHEYTHFAFDIETRPKNIVRCIAFAPNNEYAFCIPFEGANGVVWSAPDYEQIKDMLRSLFRSNLKSVAHNAPFDMWHLEGRMDIPVKNLWMDTMLAWHVYVPGLPKGLATVASVCTSQPYWKDMVDHNGVTDYEKLYEYNCIDCLVTIECAKTILTELQETGLEKFYFKGPVHKLVTPLLGMELRGVKVDIAARDRALEKYALELEEQQKLLDIIAGKEVNVNSAKQMKELFYDQLGMAVQKNRATGNTTCNHAAIVKLMRKHKEHKELFDTILEIRKIRKLVSTYLSVPIDKDGRIRTHYKVAGTITGRLASTKNWAGTGTNLQNFPKGPARQMLIPDDERVFVNVDLSQADARVVAGISGCNALHDLFTSDAPVYEIIVGQLLGKSASDVTQKERQLGKRIVHAAHYGMGWNRLCEMTGWELSAANAKQLLSRYFEEYPEIGAWQRAVKQQLKTTKRLVTPMGRARTFWGPYNGNMFRDALAYVPQSTVADVINTGLIRFEQMHIPTAEMLLQVHDSFTVQCREEYVDEVKKAMKDALDITLNCGSIEINIPTSIDVGKNWNEV